MATNDNILSIIDNTPDAIMKNIASRIKEKRLANNLTQKALSSRAGMSVASYRRFEKTGEIAFKNLVMLSIILDMSDDFNDIFKTKSYSSIEELTKQTKNKERQRGNINE